MDPVVRRWSTKGEKIYFWDDEAVEKWKKEPEVWAKRAGEAGLLPQLKKKDGGKWEVGSGK